MSVTRIYTYGCHRPAPDVSKNIHDQLFAAHQYSNKLVELERARREAFTKIREQFGDIEALEVTYKALDSAHEDARTEIQKIRQRDRKRTAVPAELAQRLASLKVKRKEASAALRAAKLAFKVAIGPAEAERKRRRAERYGEKVAPHTAKKANAEILAEMLAEDWPELWKAKARLEAEHSAACARARAECNVYWGTYLLVEEAAESAFEMSKGPPRFRRFEGEGRLGVHFAQGLPVAELFTGNEVLKIRPTVLSRMSKRQGRVVEKPAHIVSMRIGSNPDRSPIWLELPVVLHRPMPEDSVIRRAWLSVRRLGNDVRYELQITCKHAEVSRRRGDGTVAVNLAWRKLESSLRVAMAVGTDDRSQEIAMPTGVRSPVDKLEHIRHLASVADMHFDTVIGELKQRLKLPGLPEWLIEGTKTIAHWRSHAKLARIAKRFAQETLGAGATHGLWSAWRTERLAAKQDLFAPLDEAFAWADSRGLRKRDEQFAFYLELWRRKNDHLETWIANERHNAHKTRETLYRTWAKRLSEQYEFLVLEDFNLRDVAEKPKPEEDVTSWQSARRQRQLSAPSKLRDCLREAFGAARVFEVKAPGNTALHFVCQAELVGSEPQKPIESQVFLHCEKCAVVIDRDVNNCRNQLRRMLSGEHSGGGGEAATAREPEEASDSGDVQTSAGAEALA